MKTETMKFQNIKPLDEILEEVLSEMTDEEFEEAWKKTKERVGNYGTSNTLL
jgi:hypothetical protein